MEVVGAIAITLVLGYVALFFLAMAIPPLIGFDEFHIPAGIALLIPVVLACGTWWYLVGSHLHIDFN